MIKLPTGKAHTFSLSVHANKIFPKAVEHDGKQYPVDPDFRTVLRCMRVLEDRKLDSMEKGLLLRHWFFKGAKVPDPVGMFFTFISDTTSRERDGKRLMDVEQDADAIFAAFLEKYRINLVHVPFLHWREFLVLLSCLGDGTALQGRISLRDMDTSKMEGKQKAKIERMKRRVALDDLPVSEEEAALQQAVDSALSEGRNPEEEIKALKEYYENLEKEAKE